MISRSVFTLIIATLLPAMILSSAELSANTGSPEAAADDAELAELLSIIEEETELATKTKMNSDYVPGIITILYGDELEALGIRTVSEALSLVPGVQSRINQIAAAGAIIRGFDSAFNSGSIKVQVNSLPVNQDFSGVEVSALLLPIELIDRIEVIRGPGSALYGNAAFSGMVNIITKRQENILYARTEGSGTLGAGGQLHWKSSSGTTELTAAISGWSDNDAAPQGAVLGNESRSFGVITLSHGDFSFQALGLERDYSTLYEEENHPPGPPDPNSSETTWSAQIRHRRSWSSRLETEASVSYLENDFVQPDLAYVGDVAQARFDLTWKGWARQSWLAGLAYEDSNTHESLVHRPRPPGPNPPGPPPPGGPPPHSGPPPLQEIDAHDRYLWSFWVQNQIDLSEDLVATIGLRFDDFSDLADNPVSPRLALVWHAAERQIIKAQYAEGFRAPTFWELYELGLYLDQVRTETVDTSELSYTYRRPTSVTRLSLFDSQAVGVPVLDPIEGSSRKAEIHSRGVELEWSQKLNDWLKVDANISYLDKIDDNRTPDLSRTEAPAAAKWLGNLSLLAEPVRDVAIGLRWHHVGDRIAELPEAEGWNMVDLTFSWIGAFSPNLTLRAGMTNILDEDRNFLSVRPREVHGFNFPGRSVWVQISLSR